MGPALALRRLGGAPLGHLSLDLVQGGYGLALAVLPPDGAGRSLLDLPVDTSTSAQLRALADLVDRVLPAQGDPT